MKTNLVRAALVCAALALAATAAFATGDIEPIQGIPVGLEGDPGSIVIARGVTDGEGKVSFGKLAPGNYVLVIDGPSLVAAMDKLTPVAPQKKSSSGFSLGIGGGLFGGGSSRKSSSGGGGGPVGVSPPKGSHDSSNSGGGAYAETNVAVGDLNNDGPPDSVVRPGNQGNQQGTITFTVTATASSDPTGESLKSGAGQVIFSNETPYHRDAAGQGMRIAFRVPASPAGTLDDCPDCRVIFVGGTIKY